MTGEIHQLFGAVLSRNSFFLLASSLVRNSIEAMKEDGVDEVRFILFLSLI